MPWRIPRLMWLAVPLALFLYLYRLDGTGVLGPDEPRYASIAREMAQSGDWVTPRLWGEPWFEKPVLLYWMAGAAFRLGFGPEISPRLPVALLALTFLGFYWWILNREFGCRAAWSASMILGTSAAWVFYSQVGVTDVPMSATFAAAMLLALPWIARGETKFLPAASALLGFAVLAKGLVPLALAAPLVLRSKGLRDLLRWRVAVPFLLVSLPWYVLCYLRNGKEFINEFFIRHHMERLTSEDLGHVQPWWFYIPVTMGLLLPWTPLLPLLARRSIAHDARRRFLLVWLLFGLAVFSISVNKLPGYVLPLMPALAALLAISLDEVRNARGWLAASAALLIVFPVAVPAAPLAVANGLSRAAVPPFHWLWVAPAAVVGAAWILEARGKRIAALAAIAVGASVGVVCIKLKTAPELDRVASARSLWNEIRAHAGAVCVENVDRKWRYGLNYYSVVPLPDCSAESRPIRITQAPGQPPVAVQSSLGRLTRMDQALYSHSSTIESRKTP